MCDTRLGSLTCTQLEPHTPHHGCTFVGLDPEATKDHEEDQ